MKNKWLRILGVLLMGGVALLAVAAIALRLLLPPEKAKALIAHQLETRLHREVRLGDVSLGIFQGLHVTNVAISEHPTFAAGTFVESRLLAVSISLPALLAKKIIVTDFRLNEPTIHLVRAADGRFNFSDLTESSTGTTATPQPVAAAPAESKTSPEILVTQAAITDGKIRYDDHTPGGHSIELSPVTLHLGNLNLAGSADVTAKIGILSNGLKGNLETAAHIDIAKESIILKSLTFTSGPSIIKVAGNVRNFRTEPEMDLNVEANPVDPSMLAALVAAPSPVKGLVSANVHVSGPLSKAKVEAKVDATKASIEQAGAFKKPAGVTTTAQFSLRRAEDAVQIGSSTFVIGNLSITMSGKVAGISGSTPTASLSIATNEFPIRETLVYLPAGTLPADVSLDGNVSLRATVNGGADAGRVQFKLIADAARVSYGTSFSKPAGMPLSLGGTAAYKMPMEMDFSPIEVQVASAHFSGPAHFKSTPLAYNAELKAPRFDVGPLASLLPAAKEYAAAGEASLETSVKSTPKGQDISGTMHLLGVRAKAQGSQLTNIKGTIPFTLDSARSSDFSGSLNGAPFKMKLDAAKVTTHPVVKVDLDLTELDLLKLMPATPATGKQGRAIGFGFESTAWAATPAPPLLLDVSGTTKIDRILHPQFKAASATITYNLKNVSSVMDKIDGTAGLKIGKGEIDNVQKMMEGNAFAKVLLLPVSMVQKLGKAAGGGAKLPDLDHVPFRSIAGDYLFNTGVMTIKTFVLAASAFDATMTGTVALAGEQRLNVGGALSLHAGGVSALVGQNGNFSIPFKVTGTVPNPSPALDSASLIKNTAKNLGTSLLQRYGVLPGEKPAEPAASAAPASDATSANAPAATEPAASPSAKPQSAQQEAVQQGEKLLKSLFKKH